MYISNVFMYISHVYMYILHVHMYICKYVYSTCIHVHMYISHVYITECIPIHLRICDFTRHNAIKITVPLIKWGPTTLPPRKWFYTYRNTSIPLSIGSGSHYFDFPDA